MKYLNFLFAILLMFSLTSLPLAKTQKGQKIGATDAGGSTGNDTKKPKTKIGVTKTVVDDPGEEVKLPPPPPPPPSLSRIAITTNAAEATVQINGKTYKVNAEGAVPDVIDLKPGMATITVTHPDFLEKTVKVNLVKGKAINYPVKLDSRYGSLKLGGIPEEAKIFIDDKELDAKSIERDDTGLSIKKILTGTRKLKIEHPDYITRDETIEVKSGEEIADATGLKLALAIVTIKTEPDASIYIDSVPQKIKVPADGKLLIPDIKPGKRNIRVAKQGFFDEKFDQELAIGPKTLDVKLNPIPNSAEFNDYFREGLSLWDVPADWKIEKQSLKISGPAKLGFPKDGVYRDFDAQFSVKLINEKGIAWAVHIQDSGKSYYLFYLSGPKGMFPGKIRTYVVQDGKLDLNKFKVSSPTSIIKFTPTDIYTISLKVRGKSIETFIKPETGPDAGRSFPLAAFIDDDNLLTYGNVGFTTIDGEEAIIDDFNVRPIATVEEKSDKVATPKTEEKRDKVATSK